MPERMIPVVSTVDLGRVSPDSRAQVQAQLVRLLQYPRGSSLDVIRRLDRPEDAKLVTLEPLPDGALLRFQMRATGDRYAAHHGTNLVAGALTKLRPRAALSKTDVTTEARDGAILPGATPAPVLVASFGSQLLGAYEFTARIDLAPTRVRALTGALAVAIGGASPIRAEIATVSADGRLSVLLLARNLDHAVTLARATFTTVARDLDAPVTVTHAAVGAYGDPRAHRDLLDPVGELARGLSAGLLTSMGQARRLKPSTAPALAQHPGVQTPAATSPQPVRPKKLPVPDGRLGPSRSRRGGTPAPGVSRGVGSTKAP